MLRSKSQKYDRSMSLSHSRSGSWFLSEFLSESWSMSGLKHRSESASGLGLRYMSGSGKKSWEINKSYYSEFIRDNSILIELSKDEDYVIRENVAKNVNVSKEILDVLAKDKNKYVSDAARLAKIKCLL